uniref:uncharacterized protein LOC120339101 isoform X3 n=1 Tax=Styela clava TaxID=7725 RepID=UPI0019399FDA|nr:uncharacterized protein LOC120339101 isoform X3 [Styela clava]
MALSKQLISTIFVATAITVIFIVVSNSNLRDQSFIWIKTLPSQLQRYERYINRIGFGMENDSGNCYKINKLDSYRICDKLPFSSTTCGSNVNTDKNEEHMVPNIVHFVWIGNLTLHFYAYLTIRSAAANQKPDVILFHYTHVEPQGDLWIRAKQEIPCLIPVKFEEPTSWQGNELDTVVHKTDIARFDILLQHGGIYLDTDAFILRSMDPLRKFPFTMGRSVQDAFSSADAYAGTPFFDHVTSNVGVTADSESRYSKIASFSRLPVNGGDAKGSGVILSEPNSTFLQTWSNLFKNYTKNRSTYQRTTFFIYTRQNMGNNCIQHYVKTTFVCMTQPTAPVLGLRYSAHKT